MFDNKAMESFCKPIKKEVYESLCALIQNYKKKKVHNDRRIYWKSPCRSCVLKSEI